MTRALERDGLVERRPDPADARATRIHLTPRAQRLRPVAERVIRQLEEEIGAPTGAKNLLRRIVEM
jgi:DNA-binding MarR family transcriptional regulator